MEATTDRPRRVNATGLIGIDMIFALPLAIVLLATGHPLLAIVTEVFGVFCCLFIQGASMTDDDMSDE